MYVSLCLHTSSVYYGKIIIRISQRYYIYNQHDVCIIGVFVEFYSPLISRISIPPLFPRRLNIPEIKKSGDLRWQMMHMVWSTWCKLYGLRGHNSQPAPHTPLPPDPATWLNVAGVTTDNAENVFWNPDFWIAGGLPSKHERRPNVGLLLVQRRRRWANSNPTLGQRLIFAGWLADWLTGLRLFPLQDSWYFLALRLKASGVRLEATKVPPDVARKAWQQLKPGAGGPFDLS